MTELVHYEVTDGIGTITLDSPHNRNALSRQLVTELLGRLEQSTSDGSRVVVLRSADRVFCSGADLSEAATVSMEDAAAGIIGIMRGIVAHPKPVVVRLGGPVRAGGLGIVAAADIALCGDDVTFAFTESRLGLAPVMINNMIDAFAELKRSGVTILLVEQNINFAQRMGDTVAVMDNGRVVHAGSMAEFSADAQLQQSLLGLAL